MKKKEMIPLTEEENKSYEKQKVCYLCKKGFSTGDNKKYQKVRGHCHYTGKFRGTVHGICNLRYKTPKKIPVVFHNGSTNDCHFMIKRLAKEFDGHLEFLGENTEKYITFLVRIKKELDYGKRITFRLKFIDSFRYMSTSPSSLVDNLSEIYNKKCRDKNCESKCSFIGLENNKLHCESNECNKRLLKPING